MVNHFLRWIIITAVAFAAFGVFITNKVILRSLKNISIETKTTNGTVIRNIVSTNGNDHVQLKENESRKQAPSQQRRWKTDRNVTIVIHLPQSLGKALGVIAAARPVQNMAYRKFSIETKLLLRIHASPRGRATSQLLQSCFPNVALHSTTNFQDGSIYELVQRRQHMYERWDSNITDSMLELSGMKDGVHKTLQQLQSILAEESSATTPSRSLYPSSNATISVPFLQTNDTFHPTFLLDPSNIDEIRQFLTFDEKRC